MKNWFKTDFDHLIYLRAAEDCRHGCCDAINKACLVLTPIQGSEEHKRAFFRFVYRNAYKYRPKFPRQFHGAWWKFNAEGQSIRIRALIDMSDFIQEFNHRPLWQRALITLIRRAP